MRPWISMNYTMTMDDFEKVQYMMEQFEMFFQ